MANSLVAPILRLPPELLGEIVVHRVLDDPEVNAQLLRTMSSICKVWRDVTLRTPKAWSRIVYRVGKPSPTRETLYTVRDVKEWLQRSGSCKKDVAILFTLFDPVSDSGRSGSVRDKAQDELAQLIYAHAAQLRSLSLRFTGPPEEVSRRLETCFAQPMPSLQVLDTISFLNYNNFYNTTLSLSEESIARIFASAPRLHSVISSGLHLDLLSTIRPRLNAISADGVELDALLQDLKAFEFRNGFHPLLAARALHLPSLYRRGDALFPPSDFAQLDSRAEVLKLDTLSIWAGLLFQIIRFPRLVKFSLNQYGKIRSVQEETSSMFKVLLAADPPLRELELEGVWIKDADLCLVLSNLPTLESVAVHGGTPAVVRTVRDLTTSNRRGAQQWLCPRLRRLWFSHPKRKAPNRGVLQDALEGLATARRSDAEGQSPSVVTLDSVCLDDMMLVADGPAWTWREKADATDTIEDDYPRRHRRMNIQTAWTIVESLL
ncbi:hypothetical protein EXIGLDRAFT_723384 [Exidia glandulosa HHB12029]|uniref:Uncharacterized protein n=1 Tax=Exidia glandulosa HHB12029 TaxID=1314781 RepID=A0A165EVG9_EXIGL|nr:hypothetical protein EXIGLDRAFT_723384 [Exidia glandulosa HHB12029]